jgi:hypothetical protein
LYVVLTKNKIRHINIIQQTECTLNNKINEKMVILEKIRKNIKFELITTKKYMLQHLIAEREIGTVFHLNRTGPHSH